ncbi:MAG: hypothetical protein WAN30_03130 [Acidimicrobiales bacterium]
MRRTSLARTTVAGIIVSSITLVANALPAHASETSTTSLYNCSSLQVRPTSIVLTCADSNRYIENITWNSWSATDAHASGVLHWNDCTPSCYDGTWHSRRIQFIALDPKTVLSHRIFTELTGPVSAWGTGSRIWQLPTRPE